VFFVVQESIEIEAKRNPESAEESTSLLVKLAHSKSLNYEEHEVHEVDHPF